MMIINTSILPSGLNVAQSILRSVWILFFITVSSAVNAQQPSEEKIKAWLDVAVNNAEILRKYDWTMTVTTNEKAGQQTIRTFTLSFGKDGRTVRTETTPESQKPAYTGATDWTLKFIDLALSYLSVPAQKLDSFYRSADIAQDAGGMIELSSSGFLDKNDRVTIDIDKVIYIIRRISFTTLADEDDVMGTIEFEVDNTSLKYPARIKVDSPAKRLNIVVEHSNFRKVR